LQRGIYCITIVVRKQFLTEENEMSKTKITTKGQITIPKRVRERMGLRTGDELEFIEEGGLYRIKKCIPPDSLKKYRGYLKDLAGHDPDRIIEEMRGK
jgi:antitoxin PrlF